MTEAEQATLLKYLGKWLATERSERRTQLVAAKIRTAKFRKLQTVDTYDFKHSKEIEKIERT
jgi:hypothetical protein